MKAPNITPGPWGADNLPHALVVRTESPRKTKYGASRYAAIGGFDRSDSDQLAEALANATAIAAVPDLIEALNDVHELIVEAVLTGFNPQDGNWANRLFESQYKTITALMKAGCTDE